MRGEQEHFLGQCRQEREQTQKSHVYLPVGAELFLSSAEEKSTLPPEIITDPRYQEQIVQRRRLHSLFDDIFRAIPDPWLSVNEAVTEGMIEQSVPIAVWEEMTSFLAQDANNARLLLYLPFAVLPDLHDPSSMTQEMASAGECFAESIRDGWVRLLHETEPRANFVDGDILEPGLGEPERISKAGHLTPELLARHIVSQEDVLILLDAISDSTLLQSLAEGTVAAHERGLLDGSVWEHAEKIIADKIGDLRSHAAEKANYNDPDSPQISPERAAWLRKVAKEAEEDAAAEQQAQQIVHSFQSGEYVRQTSLDSISLQAIIKAGTLLADSEGARAFALQSQEAIQTALDSGNPASKSAAIEGLHHWARLGIVDHEFLRKCGVELTDLSLPSQLDEEAIATEFQDLVDAAEKIHSHPLLSRSLYPGLLVFGSRVKGYADVEADLDAAIFVRPETSLADRQQMIDAIHNDIPELASADKLVEYWTEREEGRVRLKTPLKDTRIYGGEEQIHFLLGGAWIGAGEELREIRSDLLKGYVDLSRLGEDKDTMRHQLLGQLELDTLQYRLMHKGYRKFYPIIPREKRELDMLIDGSSDFWDPGYRQVATKLFLSRVFLPDLAKDN